MVIEERLVKMEAAEIAQRGLAWIVIWFFVKNVSEKYIDITYAKISLL